MAEYGLPLLLLGPASSPLPATRRPCCRRTEAPLLLTVAPQALAGGKARAKVLVPLSRHHKRDSMHASEAVITEHAGDATVLLELR